MSVTPPNPDGFAIYREDVLKLGSGFFDTQQMSCTNNPLAPFFKGNFFDALFIKGEFPKSPLEKGDSGGCLTAMLSTLKFMDMNASLNTH